MRYRPQPESRLRDNPAERRQGSPRPQMKRTWREDDIPGISGESNSGSRDLREKLNMEIRDGGVTRIRREDC